MPITLKELQQEKNELITRMEELRKIDPAEWNAERDAEFDEVCDNIETKSEAIKQYRAQRELAAARDDRANQLKEHIRDQARTQFDWPPHGGRLDSPEQAIEQLENARHSALMGWIRHQSAAELRTEHFEACQNLKVDFRQDGLWNRVTPYDNLRGFQMFRDRYGGTFQGEFDRWAKQRDAAISPPTAGGYTVPQGFQYELERALLAFGGIRRVCRVWSTSGFDPIPWPTVNDTNNKAVRTNEATDVGASVDPAFGEVVFNTFKYSTVLVSSQELLEDSAFNLSSVFASMLGERIGRGTNEHFVSGDGIDKPTGLLTEAPSGHTAASATELTFDDILDLIHAVDPSYRAFASAGFLFNDNTLLKLRKLKDLEGRYYWNPGTIAAEPDRIFGFPYQVDQDFPNAASTTTPIAFGALEKFVVRDHAAYRFYQLNELYRKTDQVGFMAFSRHDSHLVDAGTNPIKLLTMAA